MCEVRTGHSVSLDGCIAGPNDGPESPMGEGGEKLLGWYSAGDTEYGLPGTEMVFKVSRPCSCARLSKELGGLRRRRTFDLTHGWGGGHPLGVPVFVLTHTVPQGWDYEGSPFTFVTDGLDSALDECCEVCV
jgi:dihydrofolate reductase